MKDFYNYCKETLWNWMHWLTHESRLGCSGSESTHNSVTTTNKISECTKVQVSNTSHQIEQTYIYQEDRRRLTWSEVESKRISHKQVSVIANNQQIALVVCTKNVSGVALQECVANTWPKWRSWTRSWGHACPSAWSKRWRNECWACSSYCWADWAPHNKSWFNF